MDSKYAEDTKLIECIRAGDHAAIESLLFDLCGRSIYYLSRDYKIQYEDLLGDLYLHLSHEGWKRLSQWEGRCSLRRYVEQIAIRLCLDKVRQKFPHCILFGDSHLSLVEDSQSNGDSDRLEATRSQVLRAIRELPSSRERDLVLTHCIMGLEIAETAKVLNITIQNAYKIKSRAFKHLRETLERRLADVDS